MPAIMKAKRPSTKRNMSDAAVRSKTKKTWKQWFDLLDKAGSRRMDHKQIVAVLAEHHGLSPWWQQMVTVEYEQSRGLRQKHERRDGYSISRSKTIAAPLANAFRAFSESSRRARWLDDPAFDIRKSKVNKSLRITWVDLVTSVEANFYAKGDCKTQVVVQHDKLASASAGERMKRYWAKQLDQLQSLLEM